MRNVESKEDFSAAMSFMSKETLENLLDSLKDILNESVTQEVDEEDDGSLPKDTDYTSLQIAESLLKMEINLAIYMHTLSKFVDQILNNDVIA